MKNTKFSFSIYNLFKDRHSRQKPESHFACLFILLFSLFNVNIAAAGPEAEQWQFDSIAKVIDSISLSQRNESRRLLERLYEIANNTPDSFPLLVRCLYAEANINYEQGKTDSLFEDRLRGFLDNSSGKLDTRGTAILHYSLGMHFFAAGNYADAFSISMDALNDFKELQDSSFAAKSLKLLGTICTDIGLLTLGEDFYEEAIAYTAAENHDYYSIMRNKSRIYLLKTEFRKAIDSMKVLVEPLMEKNYKDLLATTYINLGSTYLDVDLDSSYYYMAEALELIQDMDNPKMNAIILHNMGIYYVLTGSSHQKGMEHFKQAQYIMEEIGDIFSTSRLYNAMSELFEDMGMLDSALFYSKKRHEHFASITSNVKAIEAYQKYVTAFLEVSENQLTIAQQEIKLKNKQVTVAVFSAFLIIMLALFFLLLVQQKKRKKEQENRELTAKFEHEKVIQQLEKEKQKEIIDAKTREITSYSLLLSSKNNVFQQVLSLHARIREKATEADEELKKIDALIRKSFNTDEEWKSFKMHFEQVHPSFFEKLRGACGDLTEENLRFCAYFKLGLSNKQIAQILNIIPQSVFNHRYRLKKKLGFKEDDDLDAFIHSL